ASAGGHNRRVCELSGQSAKLIHVLAHTVTQLDTHADCFSSSVTPRAVSLTRRGNQGFLSRENSVSRRRVRRISELNLKVLVVSKQVRPHSQLVRMRLRRRACEPM